MFSRLCASLTCSKRHGPQVLCSEDDTISLINEPGPVPNESASFYLHRIPSYIEFEPEETPCTGVGNRQENAVIDRSNVSRDDLASVNKQVNQINIRLMELEEAKKKKDEIHHDFEDDYINRSVIYELKRLLDGGNINPEIASMINKIIISIQKSNSNNSTISLNSSKSGICEKPSVEDDILLELKEIDKLATETKEKLMRNRDIGKSHDIAPNAMTKAQKPSNLKKAILKDIARKVVERKRESTGKNEDDFAHLVWEKIMLAWQEVIDDEDSVNYAEVRKRWKNETIASSSANSSNLSISVDNDIESHNSKKELVNKNYLFINETSMKSLSSNFSV